jgi:hypothetical protein
MRTTTRMILLTAVAAMCLTAVSFAQEKAAEEKSQLNEKMSPDMTRAIFMTMSNNYQAMEKNLAELEHHMQSMMEMQQGDNLQKEMQKHMEMMNSMEKMMGEQRKMCLLMSSPEGMSRTPVMEKMPEKTMEKEQPSTTAKEKKN